jgi:hypothetical protein
VRSALAEGHRWQAIRMAFMDTVSKEANEAGLGSGDAFPYVLMLRFYLPFSIQISRGLRGMEPMMRLHSLSYRCAQYLLVPSQRSQTVNDARKSMLLRTEPYGILRESGLRFFSSPAGFFITRLRIPSA